MNITKDLVLANKILHNESVLFEAFGHVSVRNPENPNQFFLSRSLAPAQVEEDDIYVFDLDGNCLTPNHKSTFVEVVIHSEIYKHHPEVNSVCHNHAQPIIPFTVLDIPYKPLSHYGAMFYEGVPVYDDSDVSDGMIIRNHNDGERIALALKHHKAIFLRGHGVVVVGENLRRCVLNSIFMVLDAENQYKSLLLGEPKYLSYYEGKTCDEKTWSMEIAQERAWNYWMNRVEQKVVTNY